MNFSKLLVIVEDRGAWHAMSNYRVRHNFLLTKEQHQQGFVLLDIYLRWGHCMSPSKGKLLSSSKGKCAISINPQILGKSGDSSSQIYLSVSILGLRSFPIHAWLYVRDSTRLWIHPYLKFGTLHSRILSWLSSLTPLGCKRLVSLCMLSHFSCVQFFVTLRIVVCQTPLSIEFHRQEYWIDLPCPPPGDLLHLGIEPASLMSPVLAGGFFTTSASSEACVSVNDIIKNDIIKWCYLKNDIWFHLISLWEIRLGWVEYVIFLPSVQWCHLTVTVVLIITYRNATLIKSWFSTGKNVSNWDTLECHGIITTYSLPALNSCCHLAS